MEQDERILLTRNIIKARGYTIWLVLLQLDFLYRVAYLKQPISQNLDLLFIFVIVMAYVGFSLPAQGAMADSFFTQRVKRILLTGMLIMPTIAFLRGQITSVTELIEVIVPTFFGISLTFGIMYLLHKRWDSKINSQK